MNKSIQGVLQAAAVCIALAGLSRQLSAQQKEQMPPAQPVQAPMIGGAFYSMQMTNWPPFPFNPFPELPLYELGKGAYVYDDRSVDYVALREQAATSSGEGGGAAAMSGPPPPGGGGGGGGGGGVTNPPAYSVPGLKLTIPVINGLSLATSLMEANTNSAYDVFQKLVLQPTVKWLRVAGGGLGQTNFSLTVPSTNAAFFSAATATDTDGDGLSDAFEQLVTLTNPALFDSDGDGISDGDEDHNLNGTPNYVEYANNVAVTVYATRAQAFEGMLSGQFTILLPKPAPVGGVVVSYHLGGNALPATEYTLSPPGNSLAFPAGTVTATINVNAVDDIIGDELERTVELRLTNATVFAVDEHPAQVELMNNDAPMVRVLALDMEAGETKPGITNAAEFQFVRFAGFDQAMNIYFTLGGTAANGTDFNSISSPIAIPVGERAVTLKLVPKQDTLVEGMETFTLSLQANAAYVIDSSNALVSASLPDDDFPTVEITATDADAREAGANPGQFQVTRTGGTGQPLVVRYTAYGTASSTNFNLGASNVLKDYVTLSGTVTIGQGASSATIAVTPLTDTEVEPMETIIAVLRGETNYVIGNNNSATVFLDDSNPQSFQAVVTRRSAAYQPPIDIPIEIVVTRYGTSLGAAELGYWVTNTYIPPWNNWYHASGNVNAALRKILFGPNAATAVLRVSPGPGAWPPGCGVIITNNPNPGFPRILDDATLSFQNASRLLSLSVQQRVAIEGGQQAVVRVSRPAASASSFDYLLRYSGAARTDLGGFQFQSFTMPANALSQDLFFTAPADSAGEGWEPLYVEVAGDQFNAVPDTRANFPPRAQLFFRDNISTLPPQPYVDTDEDGIYDAYESLHGLDPCLPDDLNADPDRDGLNHLEEQTAGGNPNNADTDGDGTGDLLEYLSDYASLANAASAADDLNNSVAVRAYLYSCYPVSMHVGERLFRIQPPGGYVVSEIVRLTKGSNYPVRVYADAGTAPYSHYQAQLLPVTTPTGFLLDDPQGVLTADAPAPTNLSARIAWVNVPRVELAVDHNRDGLIRFLPNATDQTATARPYAFWLNDDRDIGNDDTAEDLDPAAGALDNADTVISNQRDLEDFTRLHLKLDAVSAAQLQSGALSLNFEIRNATGTPAIRLYRSEQTNGGLAYLTNQTSASQQIAGGFQTAVGTVAYNGALNIPSTFWSGMTGSNHFRPLLFEGVTAGDGQLIAVLKQGATAISESPPLFLRLRGVTNLFEHYTVGDTANMDWNAIPGLYSRAPGSGAYTASSIETQDYILFVHGWRMQPWDRRAFAHTAYKRLWWQGYKGRFGFFSWPTEYTPLPVVDQLNYDRSERKAWWSAYALRRLLQDLGRRYPKNVRVMAHSMGNVVVSESLRQQGLRVATPLIQAYAASQAATVAHAYDATGPQTIETDSTTDTPEVYAHYPLSNLPYFAGMTNAVVKNIVSGIPRIINFHNRDDYALNLAWLANQDTKPDPYWTYIKDMKRWSRASWLTFPAGIKQPTTPLFFAPDRYEIYSHIAEARSYALGAAERGGFVVRGQIGSQVNLNDPPSSFGNGSHEHSAQFRSTIMRRNSYWNQLLGNLNLQP